jgi:hypothetical protein
MTELVNSSSCRVCLSVAHAILAQVEKCLLYRQLSCRFHIQDIVSPRLHPHKSSFVPPCPPPAAPHNWRAAEATAAMLLELINSLVICYVRPRFPRYFTLISLQFTTSFTSHHPNHWRRYSPNSFYPLHPPIAAQRPSASSASSHPLPFAPS